MKLYRKVENCGPVAHPDQSGKYLSDLAETVSGEGWAGLAELGFVYEVESPVPVPAVATPASAAIMEPIVADSVVASAEGASAGGVTEESTLSRDKKADKRKAKLTESDQK